MIGWPSPARSRFEFSEFDCRKSRIADAKTTEFLQTVHVVVWKTGPLFDFRVAAVFRWLFGVEPRYLAALGRWCHRTKVYSVRHSAFRNVVQKRWFFHVIQDGALSCQRRLD